jgi:hypothetical protein
MVLPDCTFWNFELYCSIDCSTSLFRRFDKGPSAEYTLSYYSSDEEGDEYISVVIVSLVLKCCAVGPCEA